MKSSSQSKIKAHRSESLRIVTWNVNGLRAVAKGNGLTLVAEQKPDVLLLQEIKAPQKNEDERVFLDPLRSQIGLEHIESFSAEKPGYSGVLVASRWPMNGVIRGLGDQQFDREGRWIEAYFDDCIAVSCYFPNSQRDHARLPQKLRFMQIATKRLDLLRTQHRVPVLVGGDFNVAPEPIDLANPKSNQRNAGFLPEEREAFCVMLQQSSYQDAFRVLYPDRTQAYTWWSYRPGVREKNIGWRLDHFLIPVGSLERLKEVEILSDIKGSDHCPVLLELSPNL